MRLDSSPHCFVKLNSTDLDSYGGASFVNFHWPLFSNEIPADQPDPTFNREFRPELQLL